MACVSDSTGGSFHAKYPNTTGYKKDDSIEDYDDDDDEFGALVIKEETDVGSDTCKLLTLHCVS